MLRLVINTLHNNFGHNLTNNPICVQCVRWRRKPRWLPVAKSKMFRVPERKKQPEDEKLELLRLHNIYRTQMRAVRGFLNEEVIIAKETSTADHLVITPEQEQEEFERCQKLNEEWNAKIAVIRNERLAKEAEEMKELIFKRLEAKEVRESEAMQRAEEIVRLEIERSKTFITKENLDQAIEVALANPVDHNFAIDLDQNIMQGRTSEPKKTEDDKKAITSG